MARVIEPRQGGVPIHVWARTLPDGALEQLERIARQPYVVEHVAAMPDLHVASGIAVGTVFATLDTLVPSALGGDLGCGMSALRFDFPAASLDRRTLERVLHAWGRCIPVGDALHRGRALVEGDPIGEAGLSTHALERSRERLVPRHLGTLGGGNHFVELDRDPAGDLWLLVHSGSRGLGSAIAAHHGKAGEAGGEGDLPGLRLDSPEGQACWRDVEWALRFARENRARILARAAQVVTDVTGTAPDGESLLDVHHNFVAWEEHGGRTLWVHRKGAIAAPAGSWALIPGSMGTASYIVEGLGESQSVRSGSHGAGRVLSRREARAQVTAERLTHSMRRVVHDARRRHALVEEAPAAYRDIAEVLEDEADLVTPRLRLEPMMVLKG
jgi:tRNA-splicing ligase RtcB